jgi:exodeoxyribonuclease V alpha subunit
MKIVDSIIMKGDYREILCNLYTTDEVIRMVKDDGFTVIASQYNTLKLINERVRSDNYLTYHDWRYKEGESVYMTVSTASLFNGEIVKLLTVTDNSITIENVHGKDIISDLYLKYLQEEEVRKNIPIALPTYLYTFHKSQGLEFDNVAICIDHLFEFPMLYTGITRARKRVVFFTMNHGLTMELDTIFNRPVNRSIMRDFYNNHSEMEVNWKQINEISAKYINNGSVEINVIKDLYEHSETNNL